MKVGSVAMISGLNLTLDLRARTYVQTPEELARYGAAKQVQLARNRLNAVAQCLNQSRFDQNATGPKIREDIRLADEAWEEAKRLIFNALNEET